MDSAGALLSPARVLCLQPVHAGRNTLTSVIAPTVHRCTFIETLLVMVWLIVARSCGPEAGNTHTLIYKANEGRSQPFLQVFRGRQREVPTIDSGDGAPGFIN